MFDLHIKYPVIKTKQFMPVFPPQPNIRQKRELKDNTFSGVISAIIPEFTT